MRFAAFLCLLLSGCLATPGTGTSAAPGRAHDGTSVQQEATVPGLPGVTLHGELFSMGQHHILDMSATNEGTETFRVPVRCGPTWTDAMESRGQAVSAHPSQGYLQCCAWGDFGPGETLRHSFEWDELLWDGDDRHTDPPSGTYAWTGTLVVVAGSADPGCPQETPAPASLTFDVYVD
ncbi:MAG TPA: hypothetical protein VM286_02100 [Candidatus Thermoplasmatota archaeon]|nr:hypothetical protein [Candidatus Thermoplasmatota archaeon]